MDDDEPAFCDHCGASKQVAWCHAFDAWLCFWCRDQKVSELLGPVLVLP